MASVRMTSRRLVAALVAILALMSLGLADTASASGSTYARYNTGYPNTYARITWYEGSSIHTNGKKMLSASCSYGCDEGWAEMVMENGTGFRLWVGGSSHPDTDHHSFYSGVNRFRFCKLNVSCTGWKYN